MWYEKKCWPFPIYILLYTFIDFISHTDTTISSEITSKDNSTGIVVTSTRSSNDRDVFTQISENTITQTLASGEEETHTNEPDIKNTLAVTDLEGSSISVIPATSSTKNGENDKAITITIAVDESESNVNEFDVKTANVNVAVTSGMQKDVVPTTANSAEVFLSTDVFNNDSLSSDRPKNKLTAAKINFTSANYHDLAVKITLPIALVFGLFGNSVTFSTMITKPFKLTTWSTVLMALAVADNVVLLSVPFNKPFVIDFIGADLPSVNSASCKIYNFIRRASKMVSAWLIVLVCFERCIAVCFPLKVKRICTRTRTVISIVCVVLASSAYCSIWITTADIVDGLCIQTIVTPESQKKAMLLIVIGSVLIVVLPMAIMLVLTPITCVVLRRHMVLRSQISSASGQNEGYIKATAMLISLSVTYVILLTPAMISYNLAFSRKESLVTTRDTTLIIIRELSQVLELINYSSNFFLYTAFNDAFRQRVIHCVTCATRNVVVTTEATSCVEMRSTSSPQVNSSVAVVSYSK